MLARYFYDGRHRTFQTAIAMRPDGSYGPPLELVIEVHRTTLFDPPPVYLHLAYDHYEPERDILIYRTVSVEQPR